MTDGSGQRIMMPFWLVVVGVGGEEAVESVAQEFLRDARVVGGEWTEFPDTLTIKYVPESVQVPQSGAVFGILTAVAHDADRWQDKLRETLTVTSARRAATRKRLVRWTLGSEPSIDMFFTSRRSNDR